MGYLVECDLGYPEELHDLHNDYPLAPERMCVKADMLSPHTKAIYAKTHNLKPDQEIKDETVEKLILNLKDKDKYVVHIRLLRFYLEQGLVLKDIHRVIRFKQSAWLQPYIEFNTSKRKEATTDFGKDFFKLMNNAPYGKTMEDVKGHMEFSLITDTNQYAKAVSKPTYKATTIINENIVGVEHAKKKIKLNKPMSVGVSVLDLSKLHMYSFYYEVLKPRYGDKVELLYTDTDSLIVNIKTDDVYADMREPTMKQHFDFSDYPEAHPNHDKSNAKVLGKFKCETNGKPIKKAVFLKAKMYGLKVAGEKDKLTAKGCPKHTIKKYTSFDVFEHTLLHDQVVNINFNTIRSQKHQVKTLNIQKVGLSNFDNKRWYLDNINSLAYGHRRATI